MYKVLGLTQEKETYKINCLLHFKGPVEGIDGTLFVTKAVTELPGHLAVGATVKHGLILNPLIK